jgi:Undecaprenyl-phosphate galactose phosphotransferase WbaP
MISRLRNMAVVSSLVLIDLFTLASAYLFAFYTRSLFALVAPERVSLQGSMIDLAHFWWTPFIFLFFIAYERLYTQRIPFWDEARVLVKVVSVSVIIILSIVTLDKSFIRFSRLTLFFFWIFSLLFSPIFRLRGKQILYRLGLWKENVIIIGAGKAGRAAAQALSLDTHLGFNLIGFLDDSPDKIATTIEIYGRQYKIFGKVRNFKRFVNYLNISNVIIAIPSLRPDKLTKLTNTVQKHTKQVMLIPDLKGMSLLNTELCHLFAQQMFLLKINNNLKNPFNRFVKRVFDFSLSLLLLPFILLAIGIIGTLIRMDSRGPAFFVQDRLGRKGTFKCLKFRTMHLNSEELLASHLEASPEASEEWEKYKKLRSYDPRVTRVGKFLRKTSLDELPQLFNVLKGEMSLVGPRPYLPQEKDDIRESIDTILLINPGISGLWQVSGRNELTFEDRIKLDTWYILNWSVWFDIVIIFKTLGVVLKRQGAY